MFEVRDIRVKCELGVLIVVRASGPWDVLGTASTTEDRGHIYAQSFDACCGHGDEVLPYLVRVRVTSFYELIAMQNSKFLSGDAQTDSHALCDLLVSHPRRRAEARRGVGHQWFVEQTGDAVAQTFDCVPFLHFFCPETKK